MKFTIKGIFLPRWRRVLVENGMVLFCCLWSLDKVAKCTHFLATFVTLRTHPEEEEKVAVVVTFFRECDNQLRKSFSAFLIFHRLISRAQNTAIHCDTIVILSKQSRSHISFKIMKENMSILYGL